VIRDGQRQDIFARDLVPGDIIICSVGDRIPADCRLIQANELQIDESMLTGESHYAHKV
jgi:P-type E1-E2 ATPase